MKKILSHILFILLIFQGHSQGEYNNWIFGDSIWLNFNNSPTSFSLGNTASGGGISASISDAQGNLVMYSDYHHIWDNNQQILLNNAATNYNMEGAWGSCQQMFPKPCSDSIFYFFYYTYYNEFRYGVFDKTLNAGNTGMMSMGNLLHANTMGGMAVTRHSNNIDLWLTYALKDTNVVASTRISSDSIYPPVYSTITSWTTDTTLAWWQFVPNSFTEFSPDAYKLVMGLNDIDALLLFDFDNSTGIVSNENSLYLPHDPYLSRIRISYLEFSPNSQVLYHSEWDSITQYDLSLPTNAQIANSRKIIVDSNGFAYGNFDIATTPDGRMILSKGTLPYFGEILNPNDTGQACNYIDSAWYIGRPTSYSLPTIIPNIFVHREVLSDSLLCQYDTVNMYLSDTNFIDSLVWDFGDTLGAQNTSTDIVPLHAYQQYGTYPIEVIIYSGCKIDTIRDTLRINPTPIATLPNDTILCEGDSLNLFFTDTSFNYLWSTADTTQSLSVFQPDTFWIEISSICGADTDSIVVDSIIPALVHLPQDTLLCAGDSLLLDASVQSGVYIWSTGDTSATIWATQPDTFWVHSTNACKSDSDTIVVTYTVPPNINLGNDTVLCIQDSLILNAADTLSSYLWSTGDTFALDTITQTGVYWATATNICGVSSDTLEAWFLQAPTAHLGNDTVVCTTDTLQLSDTTLFGTYLWNNTSTQDTFYYNQPTVDTTQITLSVTNVCGTAYDTLTVSIDTVPTVYLPQDTTFCNGNSLILDATFSRGQYLWQDGSTDSTFTAQIEGQHWVTVSNLCGTASDTFNLEVDSNLTINLGNDTVLCLGTSITLHNPVTAPIVNWYHPNWFSSQDSVTVHQADTITLVAANTCGSFTDTIEVLYETNPIAYLGPDSTYCLDYLVTLDAEFSRSSYLWNTTDTTAQIVANQSGSYSVMVTNLCGYDDDTVNIRYDLPINFDVADTVFCDGNTYSIAPVAHNATFEWSTGSTGSTDSSILITQGGYYQVTATNACGPHHDGFLVEVDSLPEITHYADTTLCANEVWTVEVRPENTDDWYWQDGTDKRKKHLSDSGIYTLTYINRCGVLIDSFTIATQPLPMPNLGEDRVVCTDTVHLNPRINPSTHTFEWNTGQTDSILVTPYKGYYELWVYDSLGCVGYDDIDIQPCTINLFIPNSFTPNGDGKNETFAPVIEEGVVFRYYYFVIFNRWGQEVFSTNDPYASWDGTYQGAAAPIETYSYRLEIGLGGRAQRQTTVGSVTIVR